MVSPRVYVALLQQYLHAASEVLFVPAALLGLLLRPPSNHQPANHIDLPAAQKLGLGHPVGQLGLFAVLLQVGQVGLHNLRLQPVNHPATTHHLSKNSSDIEIASHRSGSPRGAGQRGSRIGRGLVREAELADLVVQMRIPVEGHARVVDDFVDGRGLGMNWPRRIGPEAVPIALSV